MTFQTDYFYGARESRFRFYRIPKALLDGGLSLEAAALYGLMLDRVGLSAGNGWTDSRGRVFIYFTLKEVQSRLRCGHNRATAFLRELERAGLIERRRQGLGRPAKIYVRSLSGGEDVAPEGPSGEDAAPAEETAPRENASCQALFSAPGEAVQGAPSRQSGAPGAGGPGCPQEAANETEKNETEKREPHPILPPSPRGSRRSGGRGRMDERRWVREAIRENIGYEDLIWDHPADLALFDGYVELMTEAACSPNKTVRICGQDLPREAVRSRFLKLGREHVLYVRDCLGRVSTPVGNIKAYLLTALYNAPVTMDQYYAALVSSDFAQAEGRSPRGRPER